MWIIARINQNGVHCCDMPEEKVVEPESMNGVYGIENARRSNFQKGWNTCINKILLENCMKRTR